MSNQPRVKEQELNRVEKGGICQEDQLDVEVT